MLANGCIRQSSTALVTHDRNIEKTLWHVCQEGRKNLLYIEPVPWLVVVVFHLDGLVQDCSNSIANALELLQSCTKPSICCCYIDSGL